MQQVHEAVPRGIAGDHAHRQRLGKQPRTPVGLGQHPRRVDNGEVELAPDHRMREVGRAGRHAQPWVKSVAGSLADDDAHVAISIVRRRRIACDVQADFPEHLAAREVGAFRERFHYLSWLQEGMGQE